MIDKVNELPEDGLKSLPETLCYMENTCIGRKIKICSFLHILDILGFIQFALLYAKLRAIETY